MAYDVDFWYISQDACEITTDFAPFSDAEEESIYMKTSDFSEMIERFTDPNLERKAKAFDEISNMLKRCDYYDRDTALDVIEIVDKYEERVDDER